MAITEDRTAATGYADDAEWRLPGARLSENAFNHVFTDDRATGNRGLSSNGKAPRVLIVDDDPAIRVLCSINLQIEGLVVHEAADGRRGLEQAPVEDSCRKLFDAGEIAADVRVDCEQALPPGSTSSAAASFRR